MNGKWSHRLQIWGSPTWWVLEKSLFYRVFGHPIRTAACEGTVPNSTVQHWIMQLSPVMSLTLVHVLLCSFILRNNGAGFLQSVLCYFQCTSLISQLQLCAYIICWLVFYFPLRIQGVYITFGQMNCSLLGINLVNLAGSKSRCNRPIIPSS